MSACQACSALPPARAAREPGPLLAPANTSAAAALPCPQVPVIPITLVGTGDLMPNAKEYLLYPGKVTVSLSLSLSQPVWAGG